MGNCTVTALSRAFASEEATRMQQRGQRIIPLQIAASDSYATNGDTVDLSSLFPSGNYTVFVNAVSNTGNRLAVYDQTNKKLKVFTALTTEAVNGTNQSVNGIFNAIAVGE